MVIDPIDEISNFKVLSQRQISQIQKGAHVIIRDNGKLYERLLEHGTKRCFCQHQSLRKVYDIPASKGSVLIGVTTGTWLQWERYPPLSFSHMCDWVLYLITGKNQGPYGSSLLTDQQPMILTGSNIDF